MGVTRRLKDGTAVGRIQPDLARAARQAVMRFLTDPARDTRYEWMAMSEFLERHPGENPQALGWQLIGGALRRPRR